MIADVRDGGVSQAGPTPAGPAGCSVTAIVLAIFLPILAIYLPGCYQSVVKYRAINRLDTEAQRTGGSAGIQGHASDIILELKGKHVDDSEFERLANSDGFKYVETLWIQDAPITDVSVERLANHPSLVVLSLPRTNITDSSLLTIMKIPHAHTADLTGTDITDEGLTKLATLKDLGSFNPGSINLSETKVTEFGVRKLAEAWKGRNIRIHYGSSEAARYIDP